MIDEACQRCGKAPAVRLIGTIAHCEACADACLAPIRARVVARQGNVDVIHRRPATAVAPRPDHGPGMWDLRCAVASCDAGWVGRVGDPCSWCVAREERQRDEERKSLLHPSHLATSDGDARYNNLSDVDKAVWNRTRGIVGRDRHDGPATDWAHRLSAAVVGGTITEAEAEAAVRRLAKRWT